LLRNEKPGVVPSFFPFDLAEVVYLDGKKTLGVFRREFGGQSDEACGLEEPLLLQVKKGEEEVVSL
jgi:hypothetical protein